MKKNLLIILAIFSLCSCIQDDVINDPVQPTVINNDLTANDFVKGSEDIPLVSNLDLVETGDVDFDSESGSFAVIDYKSSIDLEAIQGFYLKTLPQMGWKLIKNDQIHSIFARDGEKLEIEFIENDAEDGEDTVRFSMSSALKK